MEKELESYQKNSQQAIVLQQRLAEQIRIQKEGEKVRVRF